MVGAQLGQQAIKTSLIAGAIGLVLVGIFMIIVYALPGVVAALSLAIYTGLELVMLNAFDLTLTLPGICRYHSFHRYGGGCKRYYLCTYP